MAVVENVGISLVGLSNQVDAENDVVAGDPHNHHYPSKMTAAAESPIGLKSKSSQPTDESFSIKFGSHQEEKIITSQQQNSGPQPMVASNPEPPQQHNKQGVESSLTEENHDLNKGDDNGVKMSNGVGDGDVDGDGDGDGDLKSGSDGDLKSGNEGFKKEIRDLEEMLSKLNPMAEEFVPPSFATLNHQWPPLAAAGHFGQSANNYAVHDKAGNLKGYPTTKKKNSYPNSKRKLNGRTSSAQREDVIRRTVYVSDVDHQVTEEQLANLFLHCGQVVDCRVCGDPNSVLRFAFIEFTDEAGAFNALSLSGTMLGFYPVMVQPSKTAIAPVNPTFLPRSEDEREMCTRTIYCTNIDKQVIAADVKLFFESLCGQVHRLRLLGDYNHPTRIAFVEFARAESAIAALNCSGAILGSLPLRVSPSKTPVRSRLPRPSMH